MGLVKQSSRKGIGHKLLYWDKLLTILAEVEAVINTQPLTHVYGDFLLGFTLTPAHFLTGDLDVALPSPSSYDSDSEYVPKYNSTKELTNYWEKSQRKLDQFWEARRQNYLLTLRETLPLFHKGHGAKLSENRNWGNCISERR